MFFSLMTRSPRGKCRYLAEVVTCNFTNGLTSLYSGFVYYRPRFSGKIVFYKPRQVKNEKFQFQRFSQFSPFKIQKYAVSYCILSFYSIFDQKVPIYSDKNSKKQQFWHIFDPICAIFQTNFSRLFQNNTTTILHFLVSIEVP